MSPPGSRTSYSPVLTASFVSALLLASTAPALRVEISSPKTRVSVFEPVKLTVRATALRAVDVPGVVDTTGHPLLETWIDYGQGFVRYVDDDGSMREGVEEASSAKGSFGEEGAHAEGTQLVQPVRILYDAARGVTGQSIVV